LRNSHEPLSLWPDRRELGLATDFYQLTMMAGYHASGLGESRAPFELFVRKLPERRSYLVFAGLEQAIADILNLRITDEQIEYLSRLPQFRSIDAGWFESLRSLRFEGDVWSVSEGTVVFAGEPLVRVVAPAPQAQWLETLLIASLNYPTLVASKASRIVAAAQGRGVFDFGARRGHGPHAAFLAARASYLAGCVGTSHVESARLLDIPPIGTMAHSWIQSFDGEIEAFQAFVDCYGERSTLLVDTYETLEGIRRAAAIDPPIGAIRIDSGNLLDLSIQARAILDASNRAGTRIVASGDLDEYRIAELIEAGAPIDSFGVGTQMITSADAPALSMVYKLVELEGKGRMKLSEGKKTYPLAKQIHRVRDASGTILKDIVTQADEQTIGEPLLAPIVLNGKLVANTPSLETIRERARRDYESLPDRLRSFEPGAPFPIEYSDILQAEARRLGVC
jgi:nicotinate phosphoribosyltransferase